MRIVRPSTVVKWYSDEFIGTNNLIDQVQTLSVSSPPYGALATATYRFFDHNKNAGFIVDASFVAYDHDYCDELDPSGGGKPISFKTTEPVNFTLSRYISVSGNGRTLGYVWSYLSWNTGAIDFDGTDTYYGSEPGGSSSYFIPVRSGTLPGNTVIYFQESTAVWCNSAAGGDAYETSQISLVLTPLPPPSPSITATTNGVAVFWPTSAPGLVLESASSLQPPATWTTVTNAIDVVGSDFSVSIQTLPASQFFRLKRP